MQLRNDFKYALIDEYCTYWDAFDDLNEFYHRVLSSCPEMTFYLSSKQKKAVGAQGLVEKILYSQNQLWIVYYSNNKRTLMAMSDFKKDKAIKKMQEETKFVCRSEVVETKVYDDAEVETIQNEEELTPQQ